jgi:Undecaprenyl-phosphate galactose phosphotransferase WbaP
MTQSAYGRAEPAEAQVQNKITRGTPHLIVNDGLGVTLETAHAVSDSHEGGSAYIDLGLDRGAFVPADHAHVWRPHHVTVDRPFAQRIVKRSFDIIGALLLAVVFAPLMVTVALLLRRDGGTVIYRHRRVGKQGRLFECLKFRTMVADADHKLRTLLEQDEDLKAEWLQGHKLKRDPRVTPIGHFLRRTSLDELPQLWNVLRGEMSLVGPRPIVREELLRYGRSAGIYLSVKPGVTGLWQTTGRNNTDYRRRVAMDVYYVRNQSLWLDTYILIRTTGVVLDGDGAY